MSNLTTHLQDISESLGFKPSSVVVENGIAKINFAQRDGSSGRLGVSLRKPLLEAGVTSDAITATADQVSINFSQGANPARGTYPTSSGSSKLFSVQRFANGNYEMITGEDSVRGGTVISIGDRQSMMQELRELRSQKNDNSRTGAKSINGVNSDPREFLDPKHFVRLFREEYLDAINGLLDDLDQPKMFLSDSASLSKIRNVLDDLQESADDAGIQLPSKVKEAYQTARRGRFSRTGAKAEFVTAPFHHRLIDLRTKINAAESLLREGRKIGNYSNCAATCESLSNLYKEMKSVYLSSGNLNASRTGAKAAFGIQDRKN